MKVYTDGGCRSNPGPGAAAYVLEFDDGHVVEGSVFLADSLTTNNIAEYEGFLAAAGHLATLSARELPDVIEFYADSELMVRQLNGLYQVKQPALIYRHEVARSLLGTLRETSTVSVSHIPRSFNERADALCNQVMDLHGVVCERKRVTV